MNTILCIEDNLQTQMYNTTLLEGKGFTVKSAMSLAEAREAVKESPSLIILDIHLPDGNGLDFLRELRKTSAVPVIALTNNSKEEDIIKGLENGCDDYVPKPYTFNLLYARIEALLRRTTQLPDIISTGAIRIDVASKRAYVNGEDMGLKTKEFSLLEQFVQNPGKIMTAEFLYKKVWGQNILADDGTLKTTISRLRTKLSETGYAIVATRGEGYCLEKDG
jgi:DNA-binding response OmpR family regulator